MRNSETHYRVARCGDGAIHGPHVVDSGPDQPRNCPGKPLPVAATVGHTPACVAGVPLCEHGDDAAACQLAHREGATTHV
jgi:hypothetical protein